MTAHRERSTRQGRQIAAACALAIAAALAGCGGDDDTPGSPGSAGTGQPLTAAQITASQAALDGQSSPVDLTSAGSTDIASGQSDLDNQAGLAKEAGP